MLTLRPPAFHSPLAKDPPHSLYVRSGECPHTASCIICLGKGTVPSRTILCAKFRLRIRMVIDVTRLFTEVRNNGRPAPF